jgi:hypothetical protein
MLARAAVYRSVEVDLPMRVGDARSPRGAGAMQQVADWLEKLGLGQYAQRFAENEITVSILPDLTDADLKELGVLALGHRRLLLSAGVPRGGLGVGA